MSDYWAPWAGPATPMAEADIFLLSRQLAVLESNLDGWRADPGYVGEWLAATSVALLTAIEALEELGAYPALAVMLADYDHVRAQVRADQEAARATRAIVSAENARLEAEARTVECPTCGRPVGQGCWTMSAKRAPRAHHVDRLRAARSPRGGGAVVLSLPDGPQG